MNGRTAVEGNALRGSAAERPGGKGSSKGQAAIEALSYGAFFMLVFVGAVAVFMNMQSQDLSRAEYSYAQQIADGFSDQIYVTSLAGTGFSQTVSVPNDLLGKSYNVTISRPPLGSGNQASVETGFVRVVDHLLGEFDVAVRVDANFCDQG